MWKMKVVCNFACKDGGMLVENIATEANHTWSKLN